MSQSENCFRDGFAKRSRSLRNGFAKRKFRLVWNGFAIAKAFFLEWINLQFSNWLQSNPRIVKQFHKEWFRSRDIIPDQTEVSLRETIPQRMASLCEAISETVLGLTHEANLRIMNGLNSGE